MYYKLRCIKRCSPFILKQVFFESFFNISKNRLERTLIIFHRYFHSNLRFTYHFKFESNNVTLNPNFSSTAHQKIKKRKGTYKYTLKWDIIQLCNNSRHRVFGVECRAMITSKTITPLKSKLAGQRDFLFFNKTENLRGKLSVDHLVYATLETINVTVGPGSMTII